MSSATRNMKAVQNIGYGLYVLTTNDGQRDNGMIVNTVIQVTSTPERIAVTINKQSYSYETIRRRGVMNVNCLSEEAPFKVFEAFGFRSGRDVDKFAGCSPKRSENGLAVLPRYINSYLSLKVESYVDLDTHGMFICTVTEADVISSSESMTYAYYHKNVKPKKAAEKADGEKAYVRTVCGYVHKGELPEDFVCPLCNHGREFFEEIKN